MTHEELIEEAAKAIGEYERTMDRQRGDESQRIWGHRGAFVAGYHPTHEGRARAALAVFEKVYKVSARDLHMANLPNEEEKGLPQYFAPKPPLTTNRFESRS